MDPDRGTSTYSWDQNNNLLRSVDGNGTVTENDYDALGRLVATWDAADPDGTRIEYYFDVHPTCPATNCTNGAGRLMGVRYPLGAAGEGLDSYAYNARGLVAKSLRTVGDHVFAFSATYDAANRVTEQVYPGNQRLQYSFDGLDRVIKVEGYITDVVYAATGDLAEVHFANGTMAKYRYDDLQRLIGLSTIGTNGDAVVSLAMTRDRRGNVTAVDDTSTGTALGMRDAVFTLDGLQRLVGVQMGTAGRPGQENLSYAYDNLDNIVSKTSSLGSQSADHVGNLRYSPRQPRAVAVAGDTDFTYDATGSATTRGALSFEYDHRQQMVGAFRGSQQIARYSYSPLSGRILAVQDGGTTYELATDFQVRDGVTRLLIGANDSYTIELQSSALASELLPDASGDGIINAADGFAAALAGRNDDADAVLRGSARLQLLDESGTHLAYLSLDHLGSTIAVTDATGQVTEQIAYTSFGAVRESSAHRSEYASFTGKHQDESTGLMDFGLRYYSPVEGRFMSADPTFQQFHSNDIPTLGDAAGDYIFALNNPHNVVDRNGGIGTVAAVSGGVAAVIAGIALSAISLGVLNIVGGILGGAVATVKVIWDITHAPDGKKWGQLSSTQKVAVVLKGALYIAGGTAAGVASSGVSAGVSLAAGVVTEVTLSKKPEVGKKTAIAGGLAVGLVVGAIAAAIVGDFGTVAEASAVAFAEIQPVLTEGFEAARVQQKQIRQKQKAVRASSAKVAGKKQANVRLKTVKTKPR